MAVVPIDADWLAQQGPGPYLLADSGTTYLLETDITVDDTAIVIGGANITLDLNGHTVTYGNSAPIDVLNGGFEQGTGQTVAGWDLSGASTATIADNTSYLFGDQVLRLENFSTAQTIVSDPISIPRANHTYAASITLGGRGHWQTKATLSVIDVVTGEVLASGDSANVERGFSAVAHFTPTTTNAVRLELVVTPSDGITTSVDIDYATVMASYDYGILATNQWGPQLPGYENLPANVKDSHGMYGTAANFTVKNGAIVQGQGRGFSSSPLVTWEIHNGFLVENVETFVWGMNTKTIDAKKSNGDVTIRNSQFVQEVDNVANRMRGISAIALSGVDGNILVEGNTISGSGQLGITVTASDPEFTVTIQDNTIGHTSVVSNGYAIGVTALQNFVIANNTIETENGRGISIDGWSAAPTAHGEIYGNHVEVQESLNRECPTSLEARALRIRNTVDAMGPHRDIHIHDNVFIAKTSEGMATSAYGARISYGNKDGQMDDAGIVFENNVFRAVTDDASRSAKAFVLDGASQDINLELRNNIFESNHISLKIGDSDGFRIGNYDTRFVSNTVRKLTEGASVPYLGIQAGYWICENRNIQLIDMHYENDATPDINWAGAGLKDLSIVWLLGVNAVDAQGAPLAGASVRVIDKDGAEVFAGTTDADGQVVDISVVTSILRQETSNSSNITTDDRGPHRVEVSLAGYTTFSQEITLE